MLRSFFITCFFLSCFEAIFASPEAEALNIGQVAKGGVTALQDVFQVQAPLRATYEVTACQQVIVQHEFAGSYGTPYVGTTPQSH